SGGGPSMSSRLLALWLALALVLVLLLDDAQGAKGRGGKRGRGRMRSSGSARYIFYTHPKRKEYYDNPNGAQIEKASHFDYEFFLGHKIVFICVARGVPRPRITWYKDGIEIFAHPYMQISEWQLEGDRIKSKLEIDPARQMDSGNYECQADNKYAIDSRTFKADFSSLGS
ncbi:cell adhesion molecule, putative, partial [Ixodes scapularis]